MGWGRVETALLTDVFTERDVASSYHVVAVELARLRHAAKMPVLTPLRLAFCSLIALPSSGFLRRRSVMMDLAAE